MRPDFLELAEVLAIHADQIERYGGDAAIRDAALLESALAMPKAMFGGEFLHRDLFETASSDGSVTTVYPDVRKRVRNLDRR